MPKLILILLLLAALGLWALLRRRLPPHDRLIALGFLLALVAVLFFSVRLVGSVIYWSDPTHQAMTPEPWMSPGFLERSWDLPPESLASVIGIDPAETRGRSLAEIARDQGETVEELIARIEASLPTPPGKAAP